MVALGRAPSPPLDAFVERVWYCSDYSPHERQQARRAARTPSSRAPTQSSRAAAQTGQPPSATKASRRSTGDVSWGGTGSAATACALSSSAAASARWVLGAQLAEHAPLLSELFLCVKRRRSARAKRASAQACSMRGDRSFGDQRRCLALAVAQCAFGLRFQRRARGREPAAPTPRPPSLPGRRAPRSFAPSPAAAPGAPPSRHRQPQPERQPALRA